MSFVAPLYSASQVRNAGRRIRRGNPNLQDTLVLENFRASHAYVLNTFQMNARRHSFGVAASVGQRLKRRTTIIDKLRREPNMPLSAMQDIAGCRLIFRDLEQLYQVRGSLRSARFSHGRENDENKYDYIINPKATGYRGVHDIYSYLIAGGPGQSWNGLKVEIQFRTLPQHAWATAVEIADLITKNRIKFADAEDNYIRFFMLASEIISRTSEAKTSCCFDLSAQHLVDEFRVQEAELQLLQRFQRLRAARGGLRIKKNTILIFRFDQDDEDGLLETNSFPSIGRAIEEYNHLEKSLGDVADIVLVRGENEQNIRDAFRNYFTDANAFVTLIEDGLAALEGKQRA